MNSLFGVDLPTPVNFVIAFAVVLALIGAATWLVRRFGASRLDAAARGRQPRLAVIDSAAVDGRRKLVIIRRDNVEHLLMIGGPSDVVVETNIVRAAVATREAGVRNGGGEIVPRAMPLPDPTAWPLQPEPAPAPAYTMRADMRADRGPRVVADDLSYRQTPVEAAAVPAPPVRAARPAESPAGRAAEPPRATAEPAARVDHLDSARAVAAALVGPQGVPAGDQSLAEMALRLEAALRRPMAPKVAAEGGTARVAISPEAKPAREPKVAVVPPKGGAQPQPQPNNLEQEMASLLGGPGKT